MSTSAINDTGVKYIYDKLQNRIKPLEDAISVESSIKTGNPINFSTLSAQNAESTIIDLEPIQDLHGYDKPWVGGAGKNLLYTDLANIKAVNTNGTWNENVYTYDSMTYTVLQDSDNNIIGIKINGTNNLSGDMNFFITNRSIGTSFYLPTNTYNLNGCPANGSDSTYQMRFQCTRDGSLHSFGVDNGNGLSNVSVLNTDRLQVVINIKSGVSVSNKIFYPMIYLSTETDPTFAPYTNYASISGRSEIGIEGIGKNLLPMTVASIKSANTSGTWSGNTYTKQGVAYTILTDSAGNVTGIKANGTATIGEVADLYIYGNTTTSAKDLTFTSDVKVSIGVVGSSSTYRGIEWGESGQYIDGADITVTANKKIYGVGIRVATGYTANNVMFYPTIRLSTETSDFEPYTKSNSLTIQFGETVYGCHVDVENGTATVDKVIESDASTLSWYLYDNSKFIFAYGMSDKKYGELNVKSSWYETKASSSTQNMDDFTMRGTTVANTIFIRDTRYSDATTFKNSLSGMQICYELATPTVIQLTPHQISLLKGVNNISVSDDYSTITLTYRSGEVATLGDLKEAVDSGECHIYSTEERVVAKWIDGRPVYEKVVFFGEIPNGVSKEVAHNIDNFYTAINISGVGRNPDTGEINFAQQRDGASIWMTPTSIGTWGTRNWDGIDFYFYITYIKDE